MFEQHRSPGTDKIIQVMKRFAADDRPGKIDLGVGVYRTPDGRTPVMAAVKSAERRVLEAQVSKGYVGLAGDPAFHAAMRGLVLGDTVTPDRIAALATPGGTGAVRQAFELVRSANPAATFWTSDPTWPNHEAILDTLGLPRRSYRYYLSETGAIDRDGMLADLRKAEAGDVVLLHGCCHNPTGADLSLADWSAVTETLEKTGALAMIDLAYHGFGDGLEADVAGMRHLVSRLPEAMIMVSASKNFGLYCDRVGLLLAMTTGGACTAEVQGSLDWLNRQSFAFPPDHGARVVTEILTDDRLRRAWEAELEQMRGRINGMRVGLAEALRAETGSDRFGFLGAHRGMFSRLPVTPDQVRRLRDEHAVYVVDDGRINIAALTETTLPRAAKAIASVID